jgi:flagellar basal-body rod modification protein FlgD
MPDPISGVGGPAALPAATAVNRTDQMGKDVFLQLLVAQMRYQDPNNPASTTDFMAQTATFTQVEKLEEIATQNASLVALQRSLNAGALVGHTVSYTDQAGTTRTGTVGSVKITGDEPSAVVNGVDVPLGRLTEVSLPRTR